jgi:hypothetical protein
MNKDLDCRCGHRLARHGGVGGLCWFVIQKPPHKLYCSCETYIVDNLAYLEECYEYSIR